MSAMAAAFETIKKKIQYSLAESKKNLDAIGKVSEQGAAAVLETPALQKMKKLLLKSQKSTSHGLAKVQAKFEEVKNQLAQLKGAFSAKGAATNLAKIRAAFEQGKPVVTDFDRQHNRLAAFRKMTIKERIGEYVENIKLFAQKLKESSQKPQLVQTDFDKRRAERFAAQKEAEERRAAEAKKALALNKQALLLEKEENERRRKQRAAENSAAARRTRQQRLRDKSSSGSELAAPSGPHEEQPETSSAARERRRQEGDDTTSFPGQSKALTKFTPRQVLLLQNAVTAFQGNKFQHQVSRAVDTARLSMEHLGRGLQDTSATIRADKDRLACRRICRFR